MKNILKIITISYFAWSCCNEKPDVRQFTDEDLKYCKTYNSYDTLVFQNTSFKTQKLVIRGQNNILDFRQGKGLYSWSNCGENRITSRRTGVIYENKQLIFSNTIDLREQGISTDIYSTCYSKTGDSSKRMVQSYLTISSFKGKPIDTPALKLSTDLDSAFILIEPYKGPTMIKLLSDTSIYYFKEVKPKI